MMRFFVSVVILVFCNTVFAENCPMYNLKPGQKNVRAYLNINIPANCNSVDVFQCPGGKRLVETSGTVGNSKKISLRCFENSDKEIEKYQAARRLLDISMIIDDGQKFSADKATSEKEALRKASLAKGIPAVVFDRAYANYLDLMKQGKTSRGCFMAADLTTPETGKTWTICMGAPPTVTESPTYWGSGAGEPGDCDNDIFNNTRSQCAKFFGNKPKYCLSAGGRYVTSEVHRDTGVPREFVNLIGLDKGDNDNTDIRNVGIHQTSTKDGRKDYIGNMDRRYYSQGCLTIPFRGKDPIDADMTEFSSRQPQGGMAVYVYPSKADILEFRSTGKAPYWNATCAKEIGKPGWAGANDSALPSVMEVIAGDQLRAPQSATRPGSSSRSPAGVN